MLAGFGLEEQLSGALWNLGKFRDDCLPVHLGDTHLMEALGK